MTAQDLWPQIRAEVAEALSQTSRDLLGVFPVVEVATVESRGADPMLAQIVDELHERSMTVQRAESIHAALTPAAMDGEGDTERAELAAGKCQGTWRNYPHVHLREDPTVYRQHRCGRELLHRGTCRCRYCGKDRSAA